MSKYTQQKEGSSWLDIAHHFPKCRTYEQAFRQTAEACKRLGLISCPPPLSDSQIKYVEEKMRIIAKWEREQAALKAAGKEVAV